MNCAVVDLSTSLVLNVIVVDGLTSLPPYPNSILVATPDQNGNNAVVGLEWTSAGFAIPPLVDAPTQPGN